MSLFLVQHGKSLSKETDPEQGLSEEGVSESKIIAEVAGGYGVKVSQIKHSVKKRARQTAEIMADALKPENGMLEITGIKPMDDVAAAARSLDSGENIMLVGHLPFMERLTSYLITGSIEKPVFRFQNSGIVCLDKDPDWIIKWSLSPNIG